MKRAAVVRAARVVFARDGYARTSTDAIAREAGVSTRTLYKHFDSKMQLFSFVLRESATRVADAFAEYVDREMAGATGLEAQLTAIGRALVAHRVDFPDHFALVQMISVEGPHFPEDLLQGWLQAGPLRVRAEVIRRLQALADGGLLRITDPTRAARHFIALVTFEATSDSVHRKLAADDITAVVTAGVRAFLDGYRGGPSGRDA